MAKELHCKIGQVGRVRVYLGILLVLAVTAQLPIASAEDYQQYLERLEEDARRDQERYLDDWRRDRDAPRFCAIAYAKSSNRWGYSWGKRTRGDAERDARRRCETPGGAETLCWSKGESYCALADGPKSYGAAYGDTPEIAKAEALKHANETAPGAKVILLVGGCPPVVKLWLDKK